LSRISSAAAWSGRVPFSLVAVLLLLSVGLSAALEARPAAPDSLRNQVGFLAGLVSRGRPPRQRADVEIRPDLRGVNPVWPWHIQKAALRGEAAARRALPAIRRLLAARSTSEATSTSPQ